MTNLMLSRLGPEQKRSLSSLNERNRRSSTSHAIKADDCLMTDTNSTENLDDPIAMTQQKILRNIMNDDDGSFDGDDLFLMVQPKSSKANLLPGGSRAAPEDLDDTCYIYTDESKPAGPTVVAPRKAPGISRSGALEQMMCKVDEGNDDQERNEDLGKQALGFLSALPLAKVTTALRSTISANIEDIIRSKQIGNDRNSNTIKKSGSGFNLNKSSKQVNDGNSNSITTSWSGNNLNRTRKPTGNDGNSNTLRKSGSGKNLNWSSKQAGNDGNSNTLRKSRSGKNLNSLGLAKTTDTMGNAPPRRSDGNSNALNRPGSGRSKRTDGNTHSLNKSGHSKRSEGSGFSSSKSGHSIQSDGSSLNQSGNSLEDDEVMNQPRSPYLVPSKTGLSPKKTGSGRRIGRRQCGADRVDGKTTDDIVSDPRPLDSIENLSSSVMATFPPWDDMSTSGHLSNSSGHRSTSGGGVALRRRLKGQSSADKPEEPAPPTQSEIRSRRNSSLSASSHGACRRRAKHQNSFDSTGSEENPPQPKSQGGQREASTENNDGNNRRRARSSNAVATRRSKNMPDPLASSTHSASRQRSRSTNAGRRSSVRHDSLSSSVHNTSRQRSRSNNPGRRSSGRAGTRRPKDKTCSVSEPIDGDKEENKHHPSPSSSNSRVSLGLSPADGRRKGSMLDDPPGAAEGSGEPPKRPPSTTLSDHSLTSSAEIDGDGDLPKDGPHDETSKSEKSFGDDDYLTEESEDEGVKIQKSLRQIAAIGHKPASRRLRPLDSGSRHRSKSTERRRGQRSRVKVPSK
jgi:hypothetical protein